MNPPALFRKQKGRPYRAAFVLLALLLSVYPVTTYQAWVPWQELAQERVVAFQPMVVVRFLTPLLCVAVFTVVVL